MNVFRQSANLPFSDEIQGTFEPRTYCVQYRETDWNFAARLMEEGIYYYFAHENGKHQLILGNTPQSHHDCPCKKKIAFALEAPGTQDFESAVGEWTIDYNLRTGKRTVWDYHFQLPASKLSADQTSRFNIGNNQKLEIYDYPGGYAERFDGVDAAGGDQVSQLQKIFEDKQRTNEIRQQELDVQYKIASGSSDCAAFTAGHLFELFNHPVKENNIPHVLLSIEHQADVAVFKPERISLSDKIITVPTKNILNQNGLGELHIYGALNLPKN